MPLVGWLVGSESVISFFLMISFSHIKMFKHASIMTSKQLLYICVHTWRSEPLYYHHHIILYIILSLSYILYYIAAQITFIFTGTPSMTIHPGK